MKKRGILFYFIWTVLAVCSRVLYYFQVNQPMRDTYEYFSHAMISGGEQEPLLNSGLAYAYTENLSRIFRFAGNRIEAAGVCQMIFQILWLLLFFVGVSLLFGRAAGVMSGGILLISPWILDTMFEIAPENYYMLHWSLVLVMLGLYSCRTKAGKGRMNDLGRFYLIAAGFYLGMISIWNYLGWLLVVMMAYVVIRNRICMKKQIREEKGTKEETRSLMGPLAQGFGLIEGLAVGIFVTLMRYTSLTGQMIVEQFEWWIGQFGQSIERCQDIRIQLPIHILAALGAGIFCQIIFWVCGRRGDSGVPGEPEGVAAGEEDGDYVTTEDGKKIRLLDNPLPGPKKHVKKEMDFDFADPEEREDDFDFQISAEDDFDL